MWPLEYGPDVAQKLRVSKIFRRKFSDGFRQDFQSMCQIDAQEGTASFVLIA